MARRSTSGSCAPDTASRRLKTKNGTPSTPSSRACTVLVQHRRARALVAQARLRPLAGPVQPAAPGRAAPACWSSRRPPENTPETASRPSRPVAALHRPAESAGAHPPCWAAGRCGRTQTRCPPARPTAPRACRRRRQPSRTCARRTRARSIPAAGSHGIELKGAPSHLRRRTRDAAPRSSQADAAPASRRRLPMKHQGHTTSENTSIWTRWAGRVSALCSHADVTPVALQGTRVELT